jgi:hypothetical protein
MPAAEILISDLSGRLIERIQNEIPEVVLDVSGYSPGVYFVRMGNSVRMFAR